MRLEPHDELDMNCAMAIDYLRGLSAVTEIDEDTLCCLIYAEDYVDLIAKRLYQMRREFDADSLRKNCESLSDLLNPLPSVGLPFERRKRGKYAITPEAANISQHVDQLNDDFDAVWERLQDGAEIVRKYVGRDEEEQPQLVAAPDANDLDEMTEAFCAALTRLVEIERRLRELGCFDHVNHIQKRALCHDCQAEGKSLDDDFSNELFLPE